MACSAAGRGVRSDMNGSMRARIGPNSGGYRGATAGARGSGGAWRSPMDSHCSEDPAADEEDEDAAGAGAADAG